MLEALLRFFGPGAFMPHGMCYLWNTILLRLHLFSDLLIGLSYVVISLTLGFFVHRAKRDIPFSWIFLGFGIFIVACGATHFMEVWTLWIPLYWLSGGVKLLTAVASVTVAIVLPPLLPKSLVLIRAANLSELRRNDLELANQALEIQIVERTKAEAKVRQLNAELTERIRTRGVELASVKEELACLTDALNELNDPVTTYLGGRITGWNAAAERFYGYRKEEALGQSPGLLVPAALQQEWVSLLARVASGEQIVGFETTRLKKNGQAAYVSLMLSPLRSAAGEILGTSVLTRDITERKRAEEMFCLAVEAAPNAMIMADEQGTIVLANAQTEILFGYTREELVGNSVDRLVPHPFREKHAKHRQDFLSTPSARNMGTGRDLYGVRKDGSEFSIEIGLNPIQTENGLLVLSAISDITQRKQAEEKINLLNQGLEQRIHERTLQLAAANQELEAFSYSVAHDLRGPLRSIDGFSQALLEDCGPSLDSRGKGYLHRVLAAAERMSTLIDDLLNLFRVTRSELHKQTIDLSALAKSVADNLRMNEPDRTVEFVIAENLSTCADSRLLRVVMENLLGNAWKYTGRHAHSRIEFGMSQDSRGRPAYYVADDGAGFDPQYTNRLFGAFQRLHSTAEFPGTGIGLATVQRIVQRHGGEIWAKAAVEKGATFFFTLSSEEEENDDTPGRR